MNFPASRATSPSLLPFRFGSQSDGHSSSRKAKEGSDFFSGVRIRRASTQSKPKGKGKDPVRGESSVDSSSTFGTIDRDPFASHYHHAPISFSTYDHSRPSTSDGHSMPYKQRGSLLVAASDALGFKFSRRRPPVRQPPMPIILPDVIEIRAPRPDEEDEERNRLRQQAAQAIGLGPFMVAPDAQSRDDSTTTEEDDEEGDDETPMNSVPIHRRFGDARNSGSAPNITKSPHDSSLSVTMPASPLVGRYRSGSMLTHRRTNSATLAPIPPFPSTVIALTPFKQLASSLPKYYPPSSLRIFALSKSWKNRFLILTTPTNLVTRGSGPAVSYLHLFKSSSAEEKELERLEINEDSVVFVAEEEVGGRRHVIKVGGVDVGALKKELNHEEGGRTMWILQITDQAEAQKWITTIKHAIFGQRTVRAGLGLPVTTNGGIEPRGDMDVMFSIRAQGLITSSPPTVSPTNPRSTHVSPPSTISPNDRNYASSISSHSVRSQATVPKPTSSGAVSTLKGLFSSSTRPRSASRAASIDSDRQDREQNEESFTSMGSNLLNMLRSSTPDVPPHSPTIVSANWASLPIPSSTSPPEHRLDRKIVDRQPLQWVTNDAPAPLKDRANRTLSLGALSLQPPPRKRWTSITPSMTPDETAFYKQNAMNGSITGSLGLHSMAETELPLSPTNTKFPFGSGEEPRQRAPSLQSVSTHASENAFSLERSSSSTKRSSKRWSRQLPHRLTPPAGPPPAVPSQSVTRLPAHPYASERPPSQASVHSDNSQRSFVSSLPSFSKRASGSSALSVKTASTSQSHTSSFISHPVSRPGSSHRSSMPPPPRPPPTFALPPAPDQDITKAPESSPASSSKSSFRNSMTNRGFRLSMMAPKPPPSTVLPPRPDDPEFKSHRRSSSGSNTRSPQLESIPASPIPPSLVVAPFPPPRGPLPPTPISSTPAPVEAPTPSVSRHTSLKQRLRILSAPSPASSTNSVVTPPSRPTTMSSVPATHFTTSPPITPIAEKITLHQNDPSFLQLHTPITPSLPPPRALPQPPDQYAELTSLSPPPRRGSKQISLFEPEIESPVSPSEDKLGEGDGRILSLSRPGSVVSLGIVSL
ncbi:hypothetical protein BDQ12DRAFT_461484 [Crucibulum laeve]|uniref:PH domain-containing protein n=1 Tax=Crucibulum laeve TaxID=68775 RepID=A0A5C3M6Y8_9AGAR|nr:hypothetical protein BDQ12DRAFT_461484 [Crucibulum laeve]